MFVVVVEMPDGPPIKEGGKSSQPLRLESTYYDAPSFEAVWKYVKKELRGMWAEGRLVKIEDAAVPIKHLP